MKIRVGGYKVKLVHKTEDEMPEKDGHFYPAEQKLVFQLATALLSLLQDNPKLVKALTKEWPCPSEATSSDASCSPSTPRLQRVGRRGTEPNPGRRRSPRPATLDATPTRRATA